MRQESTYITAIFKAQINEDLGRGDKLNDDLRITNNKQIIKELISPRLAEGMGLLEVNALLNSSLAVYSIKPLDNPNRSNAEAIASLSSFLTAVRIFLNCLWFIKDNAVNSELGFLEDRRTPTNASHHSNAIAFSFSDAEDTREKTSFTRDEIKAAREIFQNIASGGIKFGHDHDIDSASLSRFQRAFYFLQAARASPDLGVKIAHYCTCLEALFATDTSELTHKLSERVACFLSESSSERKKTFAEIKKAYGIRSRVVHGAGAGLTNEKLRETSKDCDRLLRSTLIRIINSPDLHDLFMKQSKHQEPFQSYCIDLIFNSSKDIKTPPMASTNQPALKTK